MSILRGMINSGRSFFNMSGPEDDAALLAAEEIRMRELHADADKARALKEMRGTRGWEVWQKIMREHKEELIMALRNAGHMDAVIRLQARLEEREFWENQMNLSIATGEDSARVLGEMLAARKAKEADNV